MGQGPNAFAELAQQILSCADPALLDAPLDALGPRVHDPEVRELLVQVHESGEADCLRDFLRHEQLSRWAVDATTPSELRALEAELRRWLGGRSGPDDAARLVELTPRLRELLALKEPNERAAGREPSGEALEALLAWARPYGVLDELIRPVAEVLPEAADWPGMSLAEACLGRLPAQRGGESMRSRDRVVARAREYLEECAAAHAALPARAALWRREPPDGLRALLERLRAIAAPDALAGLRDVRFVPARPVSVEADTGACRAELRAPADDAPRSTRMFLGGFEQRALHAECSCLGAAAGSRSCLHVRALAARLIDACLDPGDRLHPSLLEFVRQPSWQRFVRALRSEDAEAETAQRVVFRLRIDAAERVRVGAFVQRSLADGRWSAGKLSSPHRLARGGEHADRDGLALELMSAASRTLGAQFVLADLALLRALVEHPHLELETEHDACVPVRVSEQTVQLQLLDMPGGLLPKLSLGGVPLAPGARRRDAGYLFAHDYGASTLIVAALTPPVRRLLAALETFHGVLPPESYATLGPWLASIRNVVQVSAPAALRGSERPPPRKLLLRITPRLDEGVDLVLAVRALALGPLWPPGHGPVQVDGLEAGVAVHARRDLDWERTIAQHVVESLCLAEHMQLEAFGFRIETTQAALALLSEAARLHELLEIEWAERARKLRVVATVRAQDLKVNLKQSGSWIALHGAAMMPDAEIALRRLLDAARLGERFVQVRGDDYAEIERELFARLERAQLCVIDPMREPALAPAALPYWQRELGDQTAPGDAGTRDWLQRLARSAATAVSADALDPAWRARLRDYQQRGLAWLLASSQWAEGVCLADEMGLGKTVQAIGLLAARAVLGPALVVAPTSLVSNWQRELGRFAPELDVRLYRGAHRRERLAGLGPHCVLVGSYELLLRDRDAFEGLSFATHIADEAQVIRNARTRRARAVAGIASEFRVALTGTPIENRLGDLWSLFAWIAPGLLGSWPRFRARFAVPIERYQDAERAELLRSLVAPFILRREKRHVAAELPSRTEVVHLVELSAAEQAVYVAAARQARRAIGRRRPSDPEHHLQILAELTRLRLLACHPRLVIEDERTGSSKLEALMRLLSDLLPRGHRVLLFSQFVRHLALVREALQTAAIGYVYLDGSTPGVERAERVDRFQRGEAPVFLISLKAGGTGLNLTAADYVIHLDPWWNPAAEDQASDRAHRLGQMRPVTVVRLVAQGTIEEKVLGLHEHKRKLALAALGGGEPALQLDAATLAALL